MQLGQYEVMKYSLSASGKWTVMEREPDAEQTTAKPFPKNLPPILQESGLRGTPYETSVQRQLVAMAVLAAIVSAIVAMMLGSETTKN